MEDNFSETIAFHGRNEQVNQAEPQLAGTLAATVLRYPQESATGRHPRGVRSRIRATLTAPTVDLERLVADIEPPLNGVKRYGAAKLWQQLERMSSESHPMLALAVRQLKIVRLIIADPRLRDSVKEPRRLRTSYMKAIGQMVTWLGCWEDADHFRCSPAGAVLLSWGYGYWRGRLRVCKSCGRFMAVPRKGYARRYCDPCRALSDGRADRATGLPASKAKLWQTVLRREQKRRQRGHGLSDENFQAWKKAVVRALLDAKTTDALAKWKAQFDEKQKPGPRTDKSGD